MRESTFRKVNLLPRDLSDLRGGADQGLAQNFRKDELDILDVGNKDAAAGGVE